MEGTDSYMTSQVKTCPPHTHTGTRVRGECQGALTFPTTSTGESDQNTCCPGTRGRALPSGSRGQTCSGGKHRQAFTILVSGRWAEPCPAGSRPASSTPRLGKCRHTGARGPIIRGGSWRLPSWPAHRHRAPATGTLGLGAAVSTRVASGWGA